MKTIRKILLLLSLPVLALAQQNTFTTTTLSAAITSNTAVCFTVASGTGINGPTNGTGGIGGTQGSVGSALFIDNELIQVTSGGGTSTQVCGQRGQAGTRAGLHAANQLVWIAGDPSWFSGAAPGTHPQGTCTSSSLYVVPDIHYLDGTIWNCDSGSVWGFAGLVPTAYGAPVARTTVSDAAYTAKVWDSIIAYTALTATRAVTLPAANTMNGKVYVIIDESGSAGTDAITITAASGSSHCVSVSANYGQTQCRSNGTAWYTY